MHRDIKPSNIIVPVSGDDAVLVDFGIAKEFNPEATTTAFRTGSPGYAPPELYSTGTSIRSDIYELGATFYVLLTGSVPADALHRIRPNTYIDVIRGRSIPQEFIACHVVPVVKKEKLFQDTFAETLCYNMMLSEVVLPLVASMYVLGLS